MTGKLTDVNIEESQSFSDNDFDFSDTLSKEANGSSYKSELIAKKGMSFNTHNYIC